MLDKLSDKGAGVNNQLSHAGVYPSVWMDAGKRGEGSGELLVLGIGEDEYQPCSGKRQSGGKSDGHGRGSAPEDLKPAPILRPLRHD